MNHVHKKRCLEHADFSRKMRFRKNNQTKKIFWTLFVAMAGLVLTRVVDPVTAQQVVGIVAGKGI